MTRVSPQLIVFSYHKTGTSLFLRAMTRIAARLGLTLTNHYGLVERIDPEPDIVLLPHSLLRTPPDWPYRAIRLIRDPRDIWVSGYLYHRRCDEPWCVNTDFSVGLSIGWPQVDYSFAHWPEAWKRRYLERLNGRSYQQNLLGLSLEDGLAFELELYTGCTLAAMRAWEPGRVDAQDVRLEEAMADFDGSMLRIFEHFGLSAEQASAALEVARAEDVRRMTDEAVAARPQITSRTISKWRALLPPAHLAGFEASYGDLIRGLGYALSDTGRARPERGMGSPDADVPLGLRESIVTVSWPRDETAPGEPPSLAWPPSSTPDAGGWLATREGDGVAARPREEAAPAEAVARAWLPGKPGGAGVRLVADGTVLRPATAGPGALTFVVRPGVRRVRLESHAAAARPPDPGQGARRRLGIRVDEIVIRSHEGGETVIAADDPRLTDGWHEAEFEGRRPFRWTDGSAEIPWTACPGPAIVTVHCATVDELPARDG